MELAIRLDVIQHRFSATLRMMEIVLKEDEQYIGQNREGCQELMHSLFDANDKLREEVKRLKEEQEPPTPAEPEEEELEEIDPKDSELVKRDLYRKLQVATDGLLYAVSDCLGVLENQVWRLEGRRP